MIVIVILRQCKEIKSSSNTVPDILVPVEPYFASISAKYDVTLMSFSADLSWLRTLFLHKGCTIDVSEGTESFVTICLLV